MMKESGLLRMYISHKIIGNNLRIARNRKSLTQAQVAERLDIAAKHYGYIERGARPASLEMLGHLCEIFEVSLEEIISGALLNNSNLAGEQNKASQIERINGMLKGCSDQIVDTVAEVVESITRLEKG